MAAGDDLHLCEATASGRQKARALLRSSGDQRRDVGIVVGDAAPAIRSAVGDERIFGLNLAYIRLGGPIGLAHAVLLVHHFLGGAPFVIT